MVAKTNINKLGSRQNHILHKNAPLALKWTTFKSPVQRVAGGSGGGIVGAQMAGNTRVGEVVMARRLSTHNNRRSYNTNQSSALLYGVAGIITVVALTYSAVPLYRVVCQTTGFGGTPMTDATKFTPDHMVPVTNRKRIKVTFTASVSDQLKWSFKPVQKEISVLPGETALAFFKAKNLSDHDIIGISTYNVGYPFFKKKKKKKELNIL